MKRYQLILLSMLILFASCKEKKEVSENPDHSDPSSEIKTEEVSYTVNDQNYQSYVSFKNDKDNLKPIVFVIPEWWGLNDYVKSRAEELAGLGYFAMAVDFYGDAKVVYTPEEAQKLATPFYEDPVLAKQVFDAAKEKALSFQNADKNKMAVIGYCFGGAQALNMARQEADLKGAVSFHGNLETGVKPNNNAVKILVLNGEADTFVSKEEIDAFKREMDSANITYEFINYPGAIHGFTNPASTETGEKYNLKVAYNKAADQKSWQQMKSFLADIFN